MTMPIRRALGALTCSLILGACAATSTPSAPSARPVAVGVASPSTPVTTPVPVATASASAVAAPSDAAPAVRRLAGFGAPILAGDYEFRETEPNTRFTVGDGWSVAATMPRHFELRSALLPDDDMLTAWYDMRLSASGPECAEAPEPGAGHTAADIVTGFTTRDGVAATTPKPITVGGLQGQWFDLRLDPAWTTPCPFTDGVPSVPLFVDADVDGEPAFWGISTDERERMIVLDDGAGSNIIVMIDSTAGKTFDRLVDVSMPVIDSMQFAGATD